MASIEELKNRIDLHDLAEKLGLKPAKPGSTARNRLYHSPHRKDEKPSFSVYERNGVQGYKDHATNEGGTCIDMIMSVRGLSDVADAMRELHELYGWPMDNPKKDEPRRELSTIEYIADRCLADTAPAVQYLVEQRGISQDIAEQAVRRKSVGFNTWTSTKVASGEAGHGGPAAAFIVRSQISGQIVAVDLRYLDPELNGKVKTQCQGEKSGYGWVMDWKRALQAQTIYVVESPINALSIECCGMPYTSAFAIRGVGNVDNIDLTWLRGKQVVICMDNDEPFPDLDEKGNKHPQAGIRPGLKAAWALHERLTSLDISALLVDQSEWHFNDVNDILCKGGGAHELKVALWKLEQCLIPGYQSNNEKLGESRKGRGRLYLPYHHENQYWRFRVRPDFTSYIEKIEERDGEGGSKISTPHFVDLAGFRVASISRVTIASATATMTGDEDSQPRTLFAVSVQTTRHGAQLKRKVVEDEKLHNIDTWKSFGPVFRPSNFLRMVNLLENAAHIGARDAANFVGLCFRKGAPVVNEGPDCYFTNPEQQCPYHNLVFPSGPRADAKRVLKAYQETFQDNAATMALVWALGGHLKALLGFWPHMQMQANKGAGKSTLIKRLERSIAFTMFSGQSLNTEYRLITSISHTSHPVGWEELSARNQQIIDKAVAILQESYQYTVNRRGAEMTEFMLSAPVLLAGEDVPVRGLIGKLVRTKLRAKGPIIPEDLPRFPVRQWIEFLTEHSASQVRALYEQLRQKTTEASRSSGEDDGALRMAGNYAAVLLAWRLLCEFAGLPIEEGGFLADLRATMNEHIKETSADREPWVWITEILLAELARGQFRAPFKYDEAKNREGQFEKCLLVRTSDVMYHLQSSQALRDIWNGLPVKSDRVYKQQLERAGVLWAPDQQHERTCAGRRVSHMAALSISKLEEFGLHATPVVEGDSQAGYPGSPT